MTARADGNPDPPPAGDAGTLYLIDISGYVFRAYHALPPMNNARGETTHAVMGVTSMLLKLIAERRPALLAVAMDSRTKAFRHQLYPAYKANRPPAPPDLKQQMERVRQVVEAYGIEVFQQEGMEADDLIASVVRVARERGLGVVMVSADKDLLQLVGGRVWMFDSMRDKFFGPEETVKRMGVPPEKVRDLLALVGDSSDNVPGVPSVGPKTAAALLSEHGDLDGIYRNLDRIAREKLRAKLEQNRGAAYLSRDLVTLRADLEIELDPSRLASYGRVDSRLIDLFKELGFTRLLKQLQAGGATARAGRGPAPAPAAEPAAPTATGAPATAVPDAPATAVVDAPATAVADAPATAVARELDEVGIDRLAAALRAAVSVALYAVAGERRSPDPGLRAVGLAWRDPPFGSPGEIHTAWVQAGRLAAAGQSGGAAGGALGLLLGDETVLKVSADAKRDARALASSGLELKGVAFDTTVASYLLDPARRAHSLKDVARAELGLELDGLLYPTLFPGEGKGKLSLSPAAGSGKGGEGAFALGSAAELARVTLLCSEKMQDRLVEAGCDRLMLEIEIPLTSVLAGMELAGIRVDGEYLINLSKKAEQDLTRLELLCKSLAGRDFNVSSPRQLESILFDDLGLPVVRRTKSARSTDRDTLEELALRHDLPIAVLEHRTLAKLKNTYLDALPAQICSRSGRIHTEFHQDVTATGRLSSRDPNLQNIPVRTEIGRSIRDAFLASEGWELLSSDYSQIELRVLAHLSHDPGLVEAFGAGQDVHVRTARALFGVNEAKVTREMRAQAKTVNYAVIYGQTPFALARSLRIERSRAARYIKAFFERYAGVDAYLRQVVEEARQTGFVRTLYGRRRMLPDLNSANRTTRQQAERMARNTPIQGTAADIIKIAMVAVDRAMRSEALRSRMLLTVHDELLFEAPPEEKERLGQLVREQMQGAAKLDVPLLVDQGWGKSWGQAH